MATTTQKVNLLDLDREGLREFFVGFGEKPFRSDQVMKWVYHYCVDDFEQMTNLNKPLLDKRANIAETKAPPIKTQQQAADGTIKFAIDIGDGREVVSVWIPEEDRATLCVSSQMGSALNCTFCSTSQLALNCN